jgi:hypothetical protein
MKIRYALAAVVAATSIATAACEMPEDGTAADRAETKDAAKQGAEAVVENADAPARQGKAGKQGKEDEKQAAQEKPAAPAETGAQTQARKSAETYLDMTGFSRTGLIKQLKFEGFSEADATYGVDAQKADWNAQAALSAKNYLEISSFSRQSLVQQLKFEGYTQQQAEYAATQVGL